MNNEIFNKRYIQDIKSGSVSNMSDTADNLIRILTDAIINNTIEKTWKVLKSETKKFEALTNYLEIYNSTEKQKVYYFAVMKTVIEINGLLNEKTTEQNYYKKYTNYKYIYPILQQLSITNTLSHGRLAECIGISKNSLSNFFRRTNEFGLWKAEQHGKKHYYTITAKGKRVYKEYALQEIAENNSKYVKVMTDFLDLISSELENRVPKSENVIKSMNEIYGEGMSIFSSDVLKLKLRTLFIKREIGIRKRKEREVFRTSEEWNSELVFYNEVYEEDEMIKAYGEDTLELGFLPKSEEVY